MCRIGYDSYLIVLREVTYGTEQGSCSSYRFLLGGCSSGEHNNDDNNNGNSYSLNDGQLVYPSEEAANAMEGACATFEEAADVTPADTHDVGASLVLKLATPGLADSLTPNSCPDDFVYANFK